MMNTKPDRNKQPEFKDIALFNIGEMINAQKVILDNGIKSYYINSGTQEVCKIELVFNAGAWYQQLPGIAKATNILSIEGTSEMSAAQIAEAFDYYGAYLQTEWDNDTASITIYCINKYLENTLPILQSVLNDAIFPQKELDVYRQNTLQKLKVDSEKVNYLSRKMFYQTVFGMNHPYGKPLNPEHIENITSQQLSDFYQKHYINGNCKIIASGMIPGYLPELINKCFGQNYKVNKFIHETSENDEILPFQNKAICRKKDAVQTSIRIGKRLFNKKSADYPAMQVLNTVLGGYFGSRLMNNIREDKGYTYGVGSALVSYVREGVFFISTEVGKNVTDNAVNEIFFEINRLKQEPIEKPELDKVKNYMMGEFLRAVDGPFSLAERLKSVLDYEMEYDYFDYFLSTIKNIDSQQLMMLANKYFDTDSLTTVLAGDVS
jgi:zinc protease